MKTYTVKEIFGPTIQGEGTHTGRVVLFLRFAGCNKWTGLEKDRAKSMCKFCDTDFRNGIKMTDTEILSKLLAQSHSVKTIVISGGEPTLQIDEALCKTLTLNGFKLHLETNGSRDLGELAQYFEHITMSPKQAKKDTNLKKCHDLKILYPNIDPLITLEEFSDFSCSQKYLQPVMDKDYDTNLRQTVCRLYGNPEWKLSLQTHKITGVK